MGPPIPGEPQEWYAYIDGQRPHVTEAFRRRYPQAPPQWNNAVKFDAQYRSAVVRLSG